MEITLEQSHEYEMATRKQSDCDHWHKLRKNRITASTFKRVCSRKANHDTLASALLTTRSVKTPAMKFGIENEPVAAQLYSSGFGRNVYAVGLVVNPSCCFLGASPDRRVYDPDVPSDPWGLLEIKCTMQGSVALMEEATKCLFRTSLRSTHSTRMCFTVSGHWQVPHSGIVDIYSSARDR